MPTVPSPCPQCRGTGQLFFWLEQPYGVERLMFWRLFLGVGYLRFPCSLCHAYGTLRPEALPDADPARWSYRAPPGATGAS